MSSLNPPVATRILFDAPGPHGRRRILCTSIIFVILLITAASFVLYGLWWHYQLEPEKWLPFLEPETLSFFAEGVLGTLIATLDRKSVV